MVLRLQLISCFYRYLYARIHSFTYNLYITMNRRVQFCFLVALIGAVSVDARSTRKGCYVKIFDELDDDHQFLMLKANKETSINERFWYPSGGSKGEINFPEGALIDAACPGGKLRINGQNTKYDSAEAKCTSGKFEVLGQTVALGAISCSTLPFHTARYSGHSCLGKYREIEVGFLLGTGEFLKHMSICFDDSMQNTLYTEFNMTKYIDAYQRSFPRPEFIQGSFYHTSKSLNTLYTRKNQRGVINSLVGLPSSSMKYVGQTDDFFLSKGHLVAKADLVYGAQQRMTFFYVNVAPQWQTFNGNNWNTLEQDVRGFVADHGSDVTIITGTHGIATLPHESSGKDIPLYLYVDGSKKGLPVPKFYWRVLYDPSSKAGVAFVGLNDPYHEQPKVETICADVSSEIDWLHWEVKNMTYGYSYACEVDELRKVVTTIPDFYVESLLV